MQSSDPRWRKFWQNLFWFVITVMTLIVLMRFLRSPVVLVALWGVGIFWGGFLAYKLSRLIFGGHELDISDARSRSYLEQALDYQSKIERAIRETTSADRRHNLVQIVGQVEGLINAIDALVERISSLRGDDVIRRDLQSVPHAIRDLESRLSAETDDSVRSQLERTLTNRRRQLESLQALQSTIKRAEIQIESTLSQLGTIYSQLLTGQSTSQVADYSRLSADIGEEVRLLQDHLDALREVKLGEV